jgi:hypothetical protein
MDPQFEELAQRLKRELTTVVADQFAAAELRLVGEYKIHAEEMKAEVKLAAEGYGATLEGIDRRLTELAAKWDTKITDHDLVLADHAKRSIDIRLTVGTAPRLR